MDDASAPTGARRSKGTPDGTRFQRSTARTGRKPPAVPIRLPVGRRNRRARAPTDLRPARPRPDSRASGMGANCGKRTREPVPARPHRPKPGPHRAACPGGRSLGDRTRAPRTGHSRAHQCRLRLRNHRPDPDHPGRLHGTAAILPSVCRTCCSLSRPRTCRAPPHHANAGIGRKPGASRRARAASSRHPASRQTP